MKAKDKLDLFHALVAEERYREARGILETEDLPPQTIEKWTTWLDALHHEERLLHGVATDKKKVPRYQTQTLYLHIILASVASAAISVPVWKIVQFVFTYETASLLYGGIFMLAAVILGFLGWRYLGAWVNPKNGTFIGAFIMLILMGITLTSGMPAWYHYEPPFRYLLVGFALVYPGLAILCWEGVGWVLRQVMPAPARPDNKKSVPR